MKVFLVLFVLSVLCSYSQAGVKDEVKEVFDHLVENTKKLGQDLIDEIKNSTSSALSGALNDLMNKLFSKQMQALGFGNGKRDLSDAMEIFGKIKEKVEKAAGKVKDELDTVVNKVKQEIDNSKTLQEVGSRLQAGVDKLRNMLKEHGIDSPFR